MSTPQRLTTSGPSRSDASPACRDLDPDAFKLHVTFMHSHGSPRGDLTTFSSPGTVRGITRPRRDGAHRR
jgi:hypothetical protein